MVDTHADDATKTDTESAEPIRPIRALIRGIETLQALNRRTNATVTDIANAVRLPRTTAYRILETLCATSLAVRDVKDDRYHLTPKVRSLSDGFDDDDWVIRNAKPALIKLAREISWPLAIATLHGTSMLVREASANEKSENATTPFSDTRLPLLASSAGRIMLATCGEEQRSMLIDILARSEKPENHIARDRSFMNRLLAEIKNNGWVIYDDSTLPELGLAVPVLVRGRFLASLTMRFTREAMPVEQAVEKYVPILKRAATEIAETFEAHAPSAEKERS